MTKEELIEYCKQASDENLKLYQALKDIEELLLSEEQPIQPSNIRYDILEIIKKAIEISLESLN